MNDHLADTLDAVTTRCLAAEARVAELEERLNVNLSAAYSAHGEVGGIYVEDEPLADNLAIVLCTYFTDHQNPPDDDPETERGWGEWVERKCDEALNLIEKRLTPNSPSDR